MRPIIDEIHAHIRELTGQSLSALDWAVPPNRSLGDLAIPCFKLSKALGKPPPAVAAELTTQIAPRLGNGLVKSVAAAGPYLNVHFEESRAFKTLQQKTSTGKLGQTSRGQGKSVVIDFSSPNVAKEMALHHLRSTCIGNALANIAKLQGFKVERINYLGDWGTSFGKYLVGIPMYGSESELSSRGLPYMLDIYVRFNKAEKDDPTLTQKARAAFKKLEDGDAECRRIWKLVREISIREFKVLYDRLGISFDHFDGESLYTDGSIDVAIKEIDSKVGTRISDGALITELPGHKVPLLLKKDDGATLYISRDIVAAEDRFKRFNFEHSWYVVGAQQKLHFQQLFDLLKALDKSFAAKCEHIPFGMLSFGSKTMSTREGNVIFLNDVVDEAVEKALGIIKEKNPDLKNAEEVAEMIGTGAVLFNDLSQNRVGDIKFDWDKALSFEGDTAPFVQYAHARCTSLIRKGQEHLKTLSDSGGDLAEIQAHPAVRFLIGEIWYFETYAERAFNDRDPSQIAASALNIAKALNQLYAKIRFLDETSKNRLQFLLDLVATAQTALARALGVLGIKAPTEM